MYRNTLQIAGGPGNPWERRGGGGCDRSREDDAEPTKRALVVRNSAKQARTGVARNIPPPVGFVSGSDIEEKVPVHGGPNHIY